MAFKLAAKKGDIPTAELIEELGGKDGKIAIAQLAMEYWPFQEAKLRKHVPGKFQGSVAIVTGAAAGKAVGAEDPYHSKHHTLPLQA